MKTLTDKRRVPIEKGDVIVTGFRKDRSDKTYDKDSLEIETVKEVSFVENSLWTFEGNLIELEDTEVLVLPDEYKVW
tara:strand:- start:1319 stop:1549 length:231 start_codon:yes stop_codon:yes gene_type:complete